MLQWGFVRVMLDIPSIICNVFDQNAVFLFGKSPFFRSALGIAVKSPQRGMSEDL